MTAYFSYVGDLDDPGFHWDNPASAPTTSNLPRRLIPEDPLYSVGVSTIYMIQKIEEGIVTGKQLDWGAWGLKMTGKEISEFFGAGHSYAEAIATLKPQRYYVLVVGEHA